MDTVQLPIFRDHTSPIEEQILPRVEQTDGCWFWRGGHNTHGRPYYRNHLVYRLLYDWFRGPIPTGLVLDHVVCDNPRCVNPWHVEATTQGNNLLRAGAVKNLGQWATKGHGLTISPVSCNIWRSLKRDQLGRFEARAEGKAIYIGAGFLTLLLIVILILILL